MKQEAIAKRLRVSEPTARDYLYGGALPRMKKLREIANTLNVDAGWLFDGNGGNQVALTHRLATIAAGVESWVQSESIILSVEDRASLYDHLLSELEGSEVTPAIVYRRMASLRRLGVPSIQKTNAS
jgi:transcriptional regulator with XRE-family HTH domain